MSLIDTLKSYQHFESVVDPRYQFGRIGVVDFADSDWRVVIEAARAGKPCEHLLKKFVGECDILVGGYAETREGLYTNDVTHVHLGIDLILPVGAQVFTPLDGVIAEVGVAQAPGDYGHYVLMRHELDGQKFYLLYAHLAKPVVNEGKSVAAGELIGNVGNESENGGWVPHLHFQVLSASMVEQRQLWGAVKHDDAKQFLAQSPDPNLILKMGL